MKLTNEIKQKISDMLESEKFKVTLYDKLDLDPEKREELGQFFTPAEICIEMIEEFDCTDFSDQLILDPCCGSGNLLIACLIAGAKIENLYGNDYDPDAVELCRRRLKMAYRELYNKDAETFEDWQIHRGNALDAFSLTEFGPDYKDRLIDHWYETYSPLALYADPDHKDVASYLGSDLIEFLEGVN